MPKVSYVEKTIFEREGFKVNFIQNGRNVRDEVDLPYNYNATYQTKKLFHCHRFYFKIKKAVSRI